jgi:hypothetical protein
MVSDIFTYMINKTKYIADDLVAIVWPRQSEAAVRAGSMTWEEAASGAWAMDPDKATRVKILLAVFDDVIERAWKVVGSTHHAEVPEGKARTVSRSTFEIVEDSRLAYLVGSPSPLTRRRNPQATFELRDLPGAEVLMEDSQPAAYGIVQIGDYTLIVSEDQGAELRVPAGAVLTVRVAA